MLYENILSATPYIISFFGSENQGGRDDFHIAAERSQKAFHPLFISV